MTIQELLKMPIGAKIGGGFPQCIKTFKKIWQTEDGWFQQVILMDKTGEMPADVNLGKQNISLRSKGNLINITVAQIQEAEYLGKDRKKLYIDQFTVPSTTEPPDVMNFTDGSEKIVRGKIKTWLVAARLQSGTKPNFVEKDDIEDLVDWIMQ